jgi:predicted phosphodiesterase
VRVAVISDVHANLEALTAVLRTIDASRVERVISLGDAVGYHANPNECLDLLARAGALTIAGNHDRAAAASIEPTEFGDVARKAVLWTRGVLTLEHRDRLRSLDVFSWLDERVCLVHAALHPRPNDRYHLTTPARIAASFAMLRSGEDPARICFFGHTHLRRVHRYAEKRIHEVPIEPRASRITLDDGHFLVNPGSVGQSRDGDPRASFAIFDDTELTLEFFRVSYDRERCLRKAESHGLLGRERSLLRRLFSRPGTP